MDIIYLRNLVLIGLERYNWVNQKVLNNNSLEFYGYILPRTKKMAILNLAIQITRLEHENNIQGNKFHLFSLPYNVECKLQLHNLVLNDLDNKFMKELENISGGIAIEGKPGPVLVGSLDELTSNDIYQVLAKHYLLAFKNGYKTYPYLN